MGSAVAAAPPVVDSLPPGVWEGIEPRRWQAEALPLVVDAVRRRERAVVSAIMGAGKSILLSELAKLAAARSPERAVVIAAPSQNLVRQLSETVAWRCGASRVGAYYGAKKQPKRQIIVTCNPSLANLAAELATQGRRVALLIADECHKTEAALVRDVVPILAPGGMIGFTATPYRSCASEALSLWDTVAYRYTLGDALRDRVLVPWRTVNWDGQGSDATDDVCVRMIREHGAGPGVVSALDIADAESYAARLAAEGIPALPIHSRLTNAEQDRRVEALKAGELRALVHVSMLAEGVDYPWLRWLCLRRPVGAKVRFMQEIGRPLRAHPGKEYAVLMDPHDLLGRHGVQHAEVLGKALEEAAEAEERAAREGEGGEPEEKELPPAKALDVSTQWARGLLLALQAAEAVPASAVPVGVWRTRRPSDAQVKRLAHLGRWFARHLPDEFRGDILALSRPHVAAGLQSGAVSDLIGILAAVEAAAPPGGAQDRGGWRFPWPKGLEIGPLPGGASAALPQRPTLRWQAGLEEPA